MPLVDFATLPDTARVWIFASDRPLIGADERLLLGEVDHFLAEWKAHGSPLRCAREWRENRFLAIGVDPTIEQASGCSIDGLFRGLQALERRLDSRLVTGGRIFYRDESGTTQLAARAELAALFERSAISPDTAVFDTSITNAADWRGRFERPARDTWVGSLLPADHASHSSSRADTKSSSVRNG